MIETKTAKRIAKKFYGMAMMPMEKEAISQRSEALAKYARSETHAERIVTALVERLTYFPTVAEIVQECENSPDDSEVLSTRKECRWCGGDGWRTVEGPFGTSAAYPCDHRGGENPNLGVVMAPSVQRHYAEETIAAKWRMEHADDLDTKFQRPPRSLMEKILAQGGIEL